MLELYVILHNHNKVQKINYKYLIIKKYYKSVTMKNTKCIKILEYLYKHNNDGKYYDVSILLEKLAKREVDRFVLELEKNNYVIKRVEGYLPLSAIPPGGDKSIANNSICKITSAGIEYLEKIKSRKKSNVISTISLIFTFLSLLIAILSLLI